MNKCFLVTTVLLFSFTLNAKNYTFKKSLVIKNNKVIVTGTLQATRFQRKRLAYDMSNYHALIYKKGRAASQSLVLSDVKDTVLFEALQKIGGKPGNNLMQATWDQRKNKNSKAPDAKILGTKLKVSIWWQGLKKPIPFSKLLNVNGQSKKVTFDFRFGGNKALIPIWKSGCLICLYSCPGSKVGNHSFTVREYEKNRNRFQVNWKVTPKINTRVAIIFSKR